MLDLPISVKLLTHASRIQVDVWEQWINDGLIVIDDSTRSMSDSMENDDLANELRSITKN